jgi:hypothetical protein
MRDTATAPLMELADDSEALGVPKNDGFFLCGHCKHVVKMPVRVVDAAESAAAKGGRLLITCPRCKHDEAQLRYPSRPRPKPAPQPVSLERGAELWAELHQKLTGPWN